MKARKTKKCTKCQTRQPIGNFTNNRSTKDGVSSWCKECHQTLVKKKNYYKRYRVAVLQKHGFCAVCIDKMINGNLRVGNEND